MKGFIKTVLRRSVRSDLLWNTFWPVLKPLYVLLATAHRYRVEPTETAVTDIAVHDIIPDGIVRHGPFKGMRYPFKQASWPCFFPRLLGSYEREIHDIIERIARTNYSMIIDVGCAEGYYAVGLARRLPAAKCFAYDVDPAAISLCKRLAATNAVGNRIEFGAHCDARTILSFPFSGRAIIVCDCEGFELELLTREVAEKVKDHDLLVEIHDFIKIETSATIVDRFRSTHNIHRISSCDDIMKAHTYHYEELEKFNLDTRKTLLAEMRPSIMEWFFMTSRTSAAE